jgi:hypothetical protein
MSGENAQFHRVIRHRSVGVDGRRGIRFLWEYDLGSHRFSHRRKTVRVSVLVNDVVRNALVAAGHQAPSDRQVMAGCTHSASCQKAASGINEGSTKVSYAEPIRKDSHRPGTVLRGHETAGSA